MAIGAIDYYPVPKSGELPENAVAWQLDGERCALLIHDMQRYFLAPFAEWQQSIVERVAVLREHCEAAGIPVIFSAQPAHQDRAERGLLFDFWGAGPDARVDIPAELDPDGGQVLIKHRYSAFHRTGLLDVLAEHGRDQLLVCGVYAHIGCLATIIDAFAHDVQAFAVADAMADFSLRHHMTALEHVATRCGAVTTVEEVRQALEPRA